MVEMVAKQQDSKTKTSIRNATEVVPRVTAAISEKTQHRLRYSASIEQGISWHISATQLSNPLEESNPLEDQLIVQHSRRTVG
jgi:DNA polymerase IIIc chi subunit